MMKLVAPFILGLALFGLGQRLSGNAAGLFLAAIGVAVGLMLGRVLRARAMRNAPAAPAALPGETPLLHGPLQLLQNDGRHDVWAYLSDQRLQLLPSGGGEGVTIDLAQVDELRPGRRSFTGAGELGVVVQGRLWRLQAPDLTRWLHALQGAVRR
jgi:hypothetical protein